MRPELCSFVSRPMLPPVDGMHRQNRAMIAQPIGCAGGLPGSPVSEMHGHVVVEYGAIVCPHRVDAPHLKCAFLQLFDCASEDVVRLALEFRRCLGGALFWPERSGV